LLPFGAESLVFCFLHRNIRIKIYRTIILHIVFMGIKLGLSLGGNSVG